MTPFCSSSLNSVVVFGHQDTKIKQILVSWFLVLFISFHFLCLIFTDLFPTCFTLCKYSLLFPFSVSSHFAVCSPALCFLIPLFLVFNFHISLRVCFWTSFVCHCSAIELSSYCFQSFQSKASHINTFFYF